MNGAVRATSFERLHQAIHLGFGHIACVAGRLMRIFLSTETRRANNAPNRS